MTTDYWANEWGPREYCYRITPLDHGSVKPVHDNEWQQVYLTLGELGYRFRDNGRNGDYIIVSLNKPIDPSDLESLANEMLINPDSGFQLSGV